MCARQHTRASLLQNREDTDGVRRSPLQRGLVRPTSLLELTKNEVDGESRPVLFFEKVFNSLRACHKMWVRLQ